MSAPVADAATSIAFHPGVPLQLGEGDGRKGFGAEAAIIVRKAYVVSGRLSNSTQA